KLHAGVAPNALHVAKGRVKRTGVHEGTREGFLGSLGAWIETPVEGSRLYWVYGGAGAGKSAVAQTLCEKYRHTHLAAAYFYSRNDSTRNTIDSFVPTIAYQLAKSPHLESHLAPAIDSKVWSDPGILNCDWEEQFQQLIYKPCTQVQPHLWLSLPRLVIIDGLDECMDHNSGGEVRAGPDLGVQEGQIQLLSMLHHFTSAQPPLPLHFLILSRPEDAITKFFRSHTFTPPIQHFDMHNLHAGSHNDIELYVRYHLALIQNSHMKGIIAPDWPGEMAIRQLVVMADGQFLYIVTAVRYISSYNPEHPLPQDRLAVVLCAREAPLYPLLSNIDQLFHQILQPFAFTPTQ
ncbi:hypothetical protein V5O48_018001, partial [Marasmius crinis-equi]